jgi:hypothetical protein
LGPLTFKDSRQVWIVSDGFVFVADYGNNRVQALTPALDFHAFVAVKSQVAGPVGVCASDNVITVAEHTADRISVLNRGVS